VSLVKIALLENARLYRSRLKKVEPKADVMSTKVKEPVNRKKRRRRESEEKANREDMIPKEKCYVCDQAGHKARDCPLRPKQEKD
jgi:hypothetical protein